MSAKICAEASFGALKASVGVRKEREEAAKAIATSFAEAGAGEEVEYVDIHHTHTRVMKWMTYWPKVVMKQSLSGMTSPLNLNKHAISYSMLITISIEPLSK